MEADDKNISNDSSTLNIYRDLMDCHIHRTSPNDPTDFSACERSYTSAPVSSPTTAPTSLDPTSLAPTTSSPSTLAPSTDDLPPNICFDSILGITAGSGAKCSVISANIEYCDYNGVPSHCPLVCDACAQFACADSTLSWDYGEDSYKCVQLSSLSDSDIDYYCEFEAVYST